MRPRYALILMTFLVGCPDPPPPGPTECFDWVAGGTATTELQRGGYQGGGPSYAAVLTALLEQESPGALPLLDLDDEGDALRICSADAGALLTARNATGRLERDPTLLRTAIARAVSSGDME